MLTLEGRAPASTRSTDAPAATRPTAPARPTAAAAAATKERNPLWDNARLIIIGLVVFGHLIESMRGTAAVDVLYAAIYAFHMPAFMLISGFFASADRLSPKQLAGTAQLLATWLVVEFAWVAIRAMTGDAPFPQGFLVMPKWGAWFLLSLFAMRVLLPYLALLPHPLLVSVAVSLGGGLLLSVGPEFSVSRTLALLPFFVLGWAMRQREWHLRPWFLQPSPALRIAAAATLAAAVAAAALLVINPSFTWELLYWRRSYAAMQFGPLTGVALRGGMLVLAIAMTFALLVLTPRRQRWYTRLGENTLYVYLLHVPLVTAIRDWRIDDRIAQMPFSTGVALALAIAITLLLSLPIVKRCTHLALEPRWLFKRALAAQPSR